MRRAATLGVASRRRSPWAAPSSALAQPHHHAGVSPKPNKSPAKCSPQRQLGRLRRRYHRRCGRPRTRLCCRPTPNCEALAGGRTNIPKIVFLKGRIDANTDEHGNQLTCDDYADPEYDFDAYLATYDPEVWGWDQEPSGPLEEARERSYRNQRDQVVIEVG